LQLFRFFIFIYHFLVLFRPLETPLKPPLPAIAGGEATSALAANVACFGAGVDVREE
jgi:hypothetical protein